MKKRFLFKVDLVEAKNRAFVYISKKRSVTITEKDVREELRKEGYYFNELKATGKDLFVFEIKKLSHRELGVKNFKAEEMKMTDLTLSYGSSELSPAPEEVINPEPEATEEKPKTTRRRRTRRKTTKTTQTSE